MFFMKSLHHLAFLFLSGISIASPLLVRESEPLSPGEELKKLKVPDGFEIQLFAAEPMINKPVNLAWDKKGRLWVSSTVEYPYAANRERWSDEIGSSVRGSRDAIKILEDTDGDGRADKVTDFADGLNIPTGVLPWHRPEHQDGCVAWSIPNIWYFADTTGDGRADYREVLFGPLGWENDTHGMLSSFRLGPDGWIYATHGFNNQSHFVARDGSTLDLQSGNVLRFRPDANAVEAWSRGQVNPFGLCFDGRGNLYSADCHSAPIYQLLQGAVYPSFGKPHDGLGFAPAMITHSHGSTGIAGIVYLDRNRWGTDWNDFILIGNPVTSRINRDKITFAGSTPQAVEKPDFLVSEDPWFRPVDLCLGGDGALYVADFYNRIIGHYEVPLDHAGRDRERGRIWRIVKKEGVQKSVPPITAPITRNLGNLTNSSPFVRRAAASHFQFAPELEALPILLKLLAETPAGDTHLRHVLRMAIRENLQLPGAFALPGVQGCDLDVVLATPGAEAAEFLFERLQSGKDLSLDDQGKILTHLGKNGGPDLLTKVTKFEIARNPNDLLLQIASLEALTRGLEGSGRFNDDPIFIEWATSLAPRLLVLVTANRWTDVSEAVSRPPWILEERTTSTGETIPVISSLPQNRAGAEQLTGVLRSAPFQAPEEISFWICGHCGPPGKPSNHKCLVRLLDSETGEELHKIEAPRNDICQRITWKIDLEKHRNVILQIVDQDFGDAYAWIGFSGISPKILNAESFLASQQIETGLRTLASLLKYSAPVGLRDQLRPYLPAAPALPATPVSGPEKEILAKLIRARIEGYATSKSRAEKGKAVFEIHCASCHRIAGDGQLIGPQLDGIGQRGLDRLCEDILNPNLNVDAHFRLTSFELKGGNAIAGFVESETDEIIRLRDATGSRFPISKAAISERKATAISLMPAIFGQSISEESFYDLLAWLLDQ
jgi:putative heme-binding domain-containing protein